MELRQLIDDRWKLLAAPKRAATMKSLARLLGTGWTARGERLVFAPLKLAFRLVPGGARSVGLTKADAAAARKLADEEVRGRIKAGRPKRVLRDGDRATDEDLAACATDAAFNKHLDREFDRNRNAFMFCQLKGAGTAITTAVATAGPRGIAANERQRERERAAWDRMMKRRPT